MKSYREYLNELVQQDFYQKNKDFYLNKKEEPNRTETNSKEELMKRVKVDDIEVYVDDDYGDIKFKNFIYSFTSDDHDDGMIGLNLYYDHTIKYLYKFILATIKKLNEESYLFYDYKDFGISINEIFKNVVFYGLYYTNGVRYFLYLTKNSKDYINKIKECKSHKYTKIIYYNNSVKGGREFFDIGYLNRSAQTDKFKKISSDDIYFKKMGDNNRFHPYFKDVELDNSYKEITDEYRLEFGQASDAQMEDNLFGKNIGHRFHMRGELPKDLRNIGLGYKIYKSFIKQVGYICSNSQSSDSARGVYNKLSRDEDFYTIVNSDEETKSKIMIIDKNYKDIKNLIEMVKEREKKEGSKFTYDKRLNIN